MIFGLNKKRLSRILAILLVVLIAPFAIELVILVDAVGIEATLAFLFLYGKSVATLARDRVVYGYNLVGAFLDSSPGQETYQHKVFTLGASASFVLFWLTGSAVLSLLAWMPAVVALANTI